MALLATSLSFPMFAAATTSEGRDARNSGIYSTELTKATDAAYGTDLPESNLAELIGLIVQGVLGVLGVVFFVLVVYAGVLWMTAGGNPDSVKKAREILMRATAGLIITLSAYAIANTVVNYMSSNIY